MTGVWPGEHGITNNLELTRFSTTRARGTGMPRRFACPRFGRSAHHAGLRTASVGWPVSVGATDVDWLIPEYWLGDNVSGSTNPE